MSYRVAVPLFSAVLGCMDLYRTLYLFLPGAHTVCEDHRAESRQAIQNCRSSGDHIAITWYLLFAIASALLLL
jgi:hypothetical protein